MLSFLQRFSPADRAGLEKMDYVWTVNGKEVIYIFALTVTKIILIIHVIIKFAPTCVPNTPDITSAIHNFITIIIII